jgi:hypothetical protein
MCNGWPSLLWLLQYNVVFNSAVITKDQSQESLLQPEKLEAIDIHMVNISCKASNPSTITST